MPCFIRARARSNPSSAYRRFRHENLAQLWNCSITLLAIFIFSRSYRQWDIKGQTKTIDDKVTHPVQLKIQLSNLALHWFIWITDTRTQWVIKFKVVNSAFKTRASSIHLNDFAHGYSGKKNLSFKTLQSVSSKSEGHIVGFDFASHGFLVSHNVVKKAFKFCASVVWQRDE